MGRSAKAVRRRTGAAKVSRGTKKRAARAPEHLGQGLPLEPPAPGEAYGPGAAWAVERTLRENYGRNGLALDVNNTQPQVRRDKGGGVALLLGGGGGGQGGGGGDARPAHVRDELAGTLGQQRSSGKRAPKMLTGTQRRVVQRLVETYGDDIAAMARDTKINKMQHSRSVLYKLVEAYKVYGDLAKVKAFHAPKKSC